MALITERNNRTRGTTKTDKGELTVQAGRTFDVSGVGNANEAEAALNDFGIVYGAPHPQDSRAGVNSILLAENATAGMYTFNVGYTSRAGANASESLLSPPIVRFEPYSYQTFSDRDIDGVPYVNSANVPFDPPLELEKEGVLITIARWEESYSIQKHFENAGRTNSETLSMPGGTLAPGQARCVGIYQGDYDATNDVVRVEYKFDCREEGWKKNVIDQGAKGWGTAGSTKKMGLFVGGEEGAPMGEVRLDGTGKPIKNDIKVSAPKDKNLPPTTPQFDSPSKALKNNDLSTGEITVLSFKRNKSRNFTLNL